MKNYVFLFIALVIATASYGQKKPKIAQALKALQENNLAEAKEIIDAGVEYEKTAEDGKTWYYRGLIYYALDTTSNAEYQALSENPLPIAMEAFAKADEIQKGTSEYYIYGPTGLPETKSQQLGNIWVGYLNMGVKALQEGDYENSLVNFEKGILVDPNDSTEYYYGALAAQNLEEYDKALDLFAKYYENGGMDPDPYKVMVYILNTEMENTEEALIVTQKAKAMFPNESDFINNEAAFLIELGKEQEARDNLLASIEENPDNPNLYFSVGVIEENLGNKEAAAEFYGKSIEKDPENFNGNFNLGALYYNDALEILKEKNNLGFSKEDLAKAKEMEPAIKEAFAKAQPYFEKCHSINPDDTSSLEVLQTIYTQTGQMDKAEEVVSKLEKLQG